MRLINLAGVLFESVSDSASRQIIGRHLDADAVAHENAYAMLAHLAGDGRQHDMFAAVQLDLEECVGLFIDNSALSRNQIIFRQ